MYDDNCNYKVPVEGCAVPAPSESMKDVIMELHDMSMKARSMSEESCIYIIKSVFDREMGNGGFNSTAFLAWAKRNDIIITDNGKRTKKARITGSATNCVCIRKNLNEFEAMQFEETEMLPL